MSQLALPAKNKWENALTKLAILVSILMIVGGAIGMVLLQKDLQQPQDWRQQASVANGQVEVSVNAEQLTIDDTNQIDFSINTHGVQTDGVQLTFNIVTDVVSEAPVFSLKTGVPLQIAYSEIETTADGFLVSVITLPSTIGQSFSTNASTPFAQLAFQPTAAGEITLNFDIENSISTVHATNPPQDELTHIATKTFSVIEPEVLPSVSPSPSASPESSPEVSPSPSTSPSVSPSPSPSASPSVSPSPSASPNVGGSDVRTCNESCASNSDCDVNLRCYSGQCRLVTNVTSSSCSAPADKGLSFSCNEYCSDTKECASGLICQSNRCRNPENLESQSCANLTVAQRSSLIKSCNESCNSNSDCDVNLRCYQGACRLATNPGSFSCSASTSKTVSNSVYGGTKGDDTSAGSSTRSAKPTVGAVDTSKTTKANGGTTNTGSNVDKNGNVIAEEKTALDTVKNYFLANPQIPMIIMGIGLGLILLLVLLSILKRANRRRPPTPPTSGGMGVSQSNQVQKSAPVYEQNLQSKINALKNQPHDSKPMAVKTEIKIPESKPTYVAPVAAVSPVAVTPVVAPKVEPAPQKEFLPPSTMRSMNETQSSTVVAPSTTEVFSAAPAAQPTASEPAVSNQPQSMLERLKSRNVTPPTV